EHPAGVALWSASTGRQLGPLEGNNLGAFSVAFSPDGRLLAIGGADGQVRLRDAETLRELEPLSTHGKDSGVHGLSFSPDGPWLASGAGDGSLRIWDLVAQKEAHCLRGFSDLRCVAYSPDGRYVAAASFSGKVGVWDAASGERAATHTAHTSPAFQ